MSLARRTRRLPAEWTRRCSNASCERLQWRYFGFYPRCKAESNVSSWKSPREASEIYIEFGGTPSSGRIPRQPIGDGTSNPLINWVAGAVPSPASLSFDFRFRNHHTCIINQFVVIFPASRCSTHPIVLHILAEHP